MNHVYKICAKIDWQTACAAGAYAGSADDLRDGFIHLSAAHQVEATLARHFAGQSNLVLIAFEESTLAGLKWETSRGGQLFPHVFSSLNPAGALWVKPLHWNGVTHDFPAEFHLCV